MKNILVIKTSPRRGGNSDMLADEFIKGATEAGHNVECVSLAGKQLGFCRGCMACMKTNRCVIKDDVPEITDKMLTADVIVWATPVYYFSCSGQMKTLIDRTNPLYTADYKFREIYLLLTAAEDEDNTVSGTITATQGWVDCYEKAELKGTVFAGGVTDKGEVAGHKALAEAYTMGRGV